MKKNSEKIRPAKRIEGEIRVPGDKSISHRAVMLNAISKGESVIKNFLMAGDCIATINAFKEMGVSIDTGDVVRVKGVGLRGLRQPKKELYLGNSGTSMRLLLGILAGQNFEAVLSGDESLSMRPMKRITEPLRRMGACIEGKGGANLAPLKIRGGALRAIAYDSPLASAQVKSAILLAGLYADGITTVREPMKSRDHTERMLKLLGADLEVSGLKVSIKRSELTAKDISVPGDISGAAFFIVAALLLAGSKITIRRVGMNETRIGIIDILRRMGADIEVNLLEDSGEPVCDITVSASSLKATVVEKEEVPRAIDELPVLMVAAAFAKGTTVINGAGELRVKETDRIGSMQKNLVKMGGVVKSEGENIIIEGMHALRGAELISFGDHRTAMAMAVAALGSSGESIINDTACVATSFPEFFNILKAAAVSK
ncbi:MAG: 3-phosphoshikimate 1-carboxyvinyltransferase [Candidatus Omnitrophica bacterium]|nr:3-phosphoshikimate 1-carboxyvinyltransferase [Candidatus Omnitrophota bacterium]MBU4487989.1 3-phosphoshikimate 1-carboxyvinyltransferase [Candidatus Omnitrophota bacterium]MCG2704768.1 3-phosphoshikimate 1-carboxyvinyltransferase [Candidatus Omnitrophota bacterium]